MSKLISEYKDYAAWIAAISRRFKSSQIKAASQINTSMLQFYWSLGRDISFRENKAEYGNNFYKNLSIDLRKELPDVKSFSVTNLHYMKWFYELYPYAENLPQAGVESVIKNLPQLGVESATENLPQAGVNLTSRESCVDEMMKTEKDEPTIGLLICKTKDNVLAKYAVNAMNAPIGISEYDLSGIIPEKIKHSLPTVEEIEQELQGR